MWLKILLVIVPCLAILSAVAAAYGAFRWERDIRQIRMRLEAAARLLILTLGLTACRFGPEPPSSAGVSPLWTYADPGGARALPYADTGIAVFTSAFGSRVVALDAGTGVLRWQKTLTDVPSGLGSPNGNVLGAGQMIIVPGWDLYAFDRTSGALRWSFAPPEEYPAGAGVALDGNIIISPGSLLRLYGVDARTGLQVWTDSLGERPFEPVVDAGVAYLATKGPVRNGSSLGAGHAIAVRTIDGQILWRTAIPDPPNSPLLGGSDRRGALTSALFVASSTNGHVYGFDRSSGAIRWEYVGTSPFGTGVAVLGGTAVAGDLAGEILGLNAESGTVTWRASSGGSSVSEQVTADSNCAYITVAALYCFTASGSIRWKQGGASQGGPIYFTPARAFGDRLYLGSETGFHALIMR
jgi:outer membrane protein assembly factor BamB